MEGMKERLDFEKLLHQRHEAELAPFAEQYRRAQSHEERTRINEKVKKEVSWQVGDWITIQLKKTEGLKDLERLFKSFGSDENTLENARALKRDKKA